MTGEDDLHLSAAALESFERIALAWESAMSMRAIEESLGKEFVRKQQSLRDELTGDENVVERLARAIGRHHSTAEGAPAELSSYKELAQRAAADFANESLADASLHDAPAAPADAVRPVAPPLSKRRSKPSTSIPQAAERTGFLIDTLGSGAELARFLGVNRSQPSQWRSGKEQPSPTVARQLLDLDYVMARAIQIWPPKAALSWMYGNNDYLDGARPIDVLKLRGAAEVVRALEVELS